MGAAARPVEARLTRAMASALDLLSFGLMTIGGVVGTLAGLAGSRTTDGAAALSSESGGDARARDLVKRAGNPLAGLALALLGAAAFAAARFAETASEDPAPAFWTAASI
jgi:hypothetical protein